MTNINHPNDNMPPEIEIDNAIYMITVDNTATLQQMVDSGKYDEYDPNINENNFPEAQQQTSNPIKLALVGINKSLNSKNLIALLEKMGIRPARLRELLAFGNTYPDKQRDYLIVGLGSFYMDDYYQEKRVPWLGGDKEERCLHLFFLNTFWSGSEEYKHYKFLVVLPD